MQIGLDPQSATTNNLRDFDPTDHGDIAEDLNRRWVDLDRRRGGDTAGYRIGWRRPMLFAFQARQART